MTFPTKEVNKLPKSKRINSILVNKECQSNKENAVFKTQKNNSRKETKLTEVPTDQ